jgi:hypothetical protein
MLPMLYSTDDGGIGALIGYTEEPMEWQRYKDGMAWTSHNPEGYKDDVEVPFIDFQLMPITKKSLELETYVVEDERYSPSAELARVYENIVQRVSEGHDTKAPDSFLNTTVSFMYIPLKDKPLTDYHKMHNKAQTWMQTFTQDWATNWGVPNPDKEWDLERYVDIAERFYHFYSNIKNLQEKDIEDINLGIEVYCDVGLRKEKNEYTYGTVPKNLIGYCWMSLAHDVANPQSYRACARQWCTRVFNENARKDIKSCTNRCSTALSRGRNAKTDVKHESIFIEVGK